jgi:hypothetical protein
VISYCPAVRLTSKDVRVLGKTVLNRLWFVAENSEALFPLGFGTLYIFARLRAVKPNAKAFYSRSLNALEVRATQPIATGEEISVVRSYLVSDPFPSLISDKNTVVGITGGKGRGIFAKRHFKPRNIIGRYPVLIVPRKEHDHIFDSTLDLYHSVWERGQIAIPLGLWMLHNTTSEGSTKTTNTSSAFDTRNREMINYAIRHICPGDEITIPYRDRSEPIEKLAMYGMAQ